MPWPDATLVPEGALTRVVWKSGPGLAGQPVTFVNAGSAFVPADEVSDELARFVESVIDRLRDMGVTDTPLSKEWQEIRAIDEEEVEFARAAARLGLDPYVMDDKAREDLVSIADVLAAPLLDEFLDSAQSDKLHIALRWVESARRKASAIRRHNKPESIGGGIEIGLSTRSWPWEQGYEAARATREALGLESTARIDLSPLVSTAVVEADSAGVHGFVSTEHESKVSLVLPQAATRSSARFAQARALAMRLLERDRNEFLLDPARTDLTKRSRAFAAELLAPADGIAKMLGALNGESDAAFEAIGRAFGASPFLVRRQYENQLLGQ
jgi:hypothetical protein